MDDGCTRGEAVANYIACLIQVNAKSPQGWYAGSDSDHTLGIYRLVSILGRVTIFISDLEVVQIGPVRR